METIGACFCNSIRQRIGILFQGVVKAVAAMGARSVYWGRHLSTVPPGSVVFFPIQPNLAPCGLTGIVAVKAPPAGPRVDALTLERLLKSIEAFGADRCQDQCTDPAAATYLGGDRPTADLLATVRELKGQGPFYQVFVKRQLQNDLAGLARRINALVTAESGWFAENMGTLHPAQVEMIAARLEDLKDAAWCLEREILANVAKTADLLISPNAAPNSDVVALFKHVNAVLNAIDRLEVRGRDSAGISLLFCLEEEDFDSFQETLTNLNLKEEFTARCNPAVLVNKGIGLRRSSNGSACQVSLTMVYKVAAEVGSLGDNITFIRWQIKNDPILQTLVNFRRRHLSIMAHTRWASVGAITEPNCHPVDNWGPAADGAPALIHACLNGDIDNFQQLKRQYEAEIGPIADEITTDTKIIPLQIERYLRQGAPIEEAFRLALNDFEGSHAIAMQTDIAPGKLFLGQRGSGQALFVGLAPDHFMPASEVYGFVEVTDTYVKLEGQRTGDGAAAGQILILDPDAGPGPAGIRALAYDGRAVAFTPETVKRTAITSRDIDRQHFPHFFVKEINESPASVEKTLQNRWHIDKDSGRYVVALDEKSFPAKLAKAFAQRTIRRIFFVGQGTAGVAARACANIGEFYLNDPAIQITALKASELSGFKLEVGQGPMDDALVVAITQSGTTADTNRTVDMAKERGAHTLAIVNRRDSDITFKVDGVVYTSSGRDIEMSVASTKAFYAQIVAGSLVGLHIAALTGRRNDAFVAAQIQKLQALPGLMRQVLALAPHIEASARRLAGTKIYWAAVGSGPNKAAADEIRIKLSELCYKTISSDYVEDKKHIDLSSEPLIIVCAAGARDAVVGDLVKDTAIFQAHKATPVVIADQGEHRFAPYAADVFYVPAVDEHFAPILNTLVGHLWGYHAALAINAGSRFFFDFREGLRQAIDAAAGQGLDLFELILEKSFREKIVKFYRDFRGRGAADGFGPMGLEAAADLVLLLKYLAGKLPVLDFQLDFGVKGTPANMLGALYERLGEAIDRLSRPVDAIKHQAKTVTVGTSRIREKTEGILFDALKAHNLSIGQITNANILVLRNLQEVVARIEGAILYRIDGLDLLGDPVEATTIEIIQKEGVLKPIPSRVETDTRLKGTKKIIVKEKNVYIGLGRKDGRSIIVIPVVSASPATPNHIEHLLLLNFAFKEDVSLAAKVKALGGKFEKIKDFVQEVAEWDDRYLELIGMRELFGLASVDIRDRILSQIT